MPPAAFDHTARVAAVGVLDAIDDWPVEHAAAAAILPDGTVEHHGEVDRQFPLASVTKVLSAVALLVATEDGTLDLDEPAGPAGATVRHLLAHASGLSPDGDRVLSAPGERRIYSNGGFELLGDLLAERSGLGIDRWIAEAIAAPLGMAATALEGSPAHGAAGSAADLVRLAADLLAASPALMAPTTRDGMVAEAFPGLAGVLPGFGQQDPNPWGLGVEIRGHKSPHWTPDEASPRTFGHFGRSGTFLWCDPGAGCGLVVLTDREFDTWAPPRWRALGAQVLGVPVVTASRPNPAETSSAPGPGR